MKPFKWMLKLMRVKMYKSLKLIVCIYMFLFISIDSCFAENSLTNLSAYDKVLEIEGNNSILYKHYKNEFAPLNTYLDMEIIDIDLNTGHLNVVPFVSETLDTVEEIGIKNNAIAAINTGFFDFTNGKSVSFVYLDGKKIASPKDNCNLTSNKSVQPYLKDIYNRAELRKLNCSGKIIYKINYHNVKNEGCALIESMQGGPMLLPEMDLGKESFLVYKDGKKVREAANVSNKDARVVVGLTSDNHMLWVIVRAGYKDSKYYGLTIEETAALMKYLNVNSALGYDGGSSTSLYLMMPDGKPHVTIGDVTPDKKRVKARVKTVLLLLKDKNDVEQD